MKEYRRMNNQASVRAAEKIGFIKDEYVKK